MLNSASCMMIDIVKDNNIEKSIGYCVSVIEKQNEKTGEVESLFIDEEYRKYGIGKELVNRAVDWLVEKGTNTQKLLVASGNDDVLDFYKQFNFYPSHIVLQRKAL